MTLSTQLRKKHKIYDTATDLLCLLSLIGIWPRFVESQNFSISYKKLDMGVFPKNKPALRVLHLTDLHLNARVSDRYLRKLQAQVHKCNADLIVFTGDFLCYGDCDNWQRLHETLLQWKAPLGVFCVPGNHDYSEYVTLENGQTKAIIEPQPFLYRSIQKLFQIPPDVITTPSHLPITFNSQLRQQLSLLGFRLLENEAQEINFYNQSFSILGFEDLWARGQETLKSHAPTLYAGIPKDSLKIVLIHNPQLWPEIKDLARMQIALSGHTHGGNVALPWIKKRLRNTDTSIPIEGWFQEESNYLLVSKGMASPYPFRLFASPQIHLLEIS